MNNFDQLKSSLISLGMAYRNKYAQWPDYAILGKNERSLVERYALANMLPSEIASGKTKTVLGFKIIESKESSFCAVTHQLFTEAEYLAVEKSELGGSTLFDGDNLDRFLSVPLEKLETTQGIRYAIVMHNTDRNPTIDAYAELNQAYDFFNQRLFNGELPKCLITLQREKMTLGYLATGRFANRHGEILDELALNPGYFAVRGITDTLSTLVHEQCHKWQHAYGKPSRPGYHNWDYANKMESIGLMTSETGLPDGKRVGQRMDHYIIPGGLFELACKELLSTNFSLSWYDRFPPINESDTTPKEKIKPLEKALAAIEEDLKFSFELLQFKDSENKPEEPGQSVKKTNKSNRAKYRCPTCKAQVWGKHELNIQCGDCSEDFELMED